jgi:hypothetical protein
MGPADICKLGSRAVRAGVSFGGFTRCMRQYSSLVNWEIISGTNGRLLQFLLKFKIVCKIYFGIVSLLLLPM